MVEIHELKWTKNISPRMRDAYYDGDVPQFDSEGLPLLLGDPVGGVDAGEDTIACWSMWIPHGRNPHLSDSLGRGRQSVLTKDRHIADRSLG
jgi:hypothetical protein